MNYKLRKILSLGLCLTMTATLTACNSIQTPIGNNANSAMTSYNDSNSSINNTINSGGTADSNNTTVVNIGESPYLFADLFTDRDLEGTYDVSKASTITLKDNSTSATDSSVTIQENTITITKEGVYLLTGSLSNGQIIVNADDKDKVQLVLSNAAIANNDTASIYIESADKVFITLAEGTTNTLSMEGTFTDNGNDSSIDGVIYSKSDLTLNGTGTLTITAKVGHGIVGKDDLKITNGTYNVTATSSALSGKDSVRIANGTFTLNAGKDGIHSENSDDTEKGYIYIANGTFTINSESDALDASSNLQIDGGIFTIDAGDDGIHADSNLFINAGIININKSYEGLEGNTITINGGDINVVSSDDGINAAGGRDGSGFYRGGMNFNRDDMNFNRDRMPDRQGEMDVNRGGMPDNSDGMNFSKKDRNNNFQDGMVPPDINNFPEGMTPPDMSNLPEGMTPPDINNDVNNTETATNTTTPSIVINGGNITINAAGDGVDSNGTLTVNGGTTYVFGPTNSGNGAIDYETTGTINGGTFVAIGAVGMAMNFDSSSTQGSMLVNIAGQSGDTITLNDSTGKNLLSVTSEKTFGTVTISTPDLTVGDTYTVAVGSQSETITLSEIIYGESNGFGGHRNFGNRENSDGHEFDFNKQKKYQ